MTFDEKAKDWDNNPNNISRAQILADEIKSFLKIDDSMNAFEFGCGTGLLSFLLKDSFKSITLSDTSAEMLKILEKKIELSNISNFNPILIDLTQKDFPQEQQKFDVIYTSMTLHHIKDIDILFQKFRLLSNPGGYLCIADLDDEDGRFHSHLDDFDGHWGFSRNAIETYLKKHGFETVYYKIVLQIEKQFNNSETKNYPVFLIIAKMK
jgi:ubiquinone/menaquinone biosynthesis C-methylase UbiE